MGCKFLWRFKLFTKWVIELILYVDFSIYNYYVLNRLWVFGIRNNLQVGLLENEINVEDDIIWLENTFDLVMF